MALIISKYSGSIAEWISGWTAEQIVQKSAGDLRGSTGGKYPSTIYYLDYFTNTQVQYLSTATIKALSLADLTRVDRSGNRVVSAFTQSQIQSISPNNLLNNGKSGSLIQYISDSQVSYLTGAQITQLTQAELASKDANGHVVVSQFTQSQIQQIAPSALQSSKAGSAVQYLSDAQVGYLSGAQITQLTQSELTSKDASGHVVVSQFTQSQIQQIAPSALQSSKAGSTVQYLSNAQIGYLTDTQIAALTPSQMVSKDASGDYVISELHLPDPGLEDLVAPKSGTTLYGTSGKPKWQDIQQGSYADCYEMAAFAELALKNSDFLKQSIVTIQNGPTLVRFFYNNQPIWISETNLFANYGALGGEESISHNYWGAALEKAWLYYDYYVLGDRKDSQDVTYNSVSYKVAEYGWSKDVLQSLTGKQAVDFWKYEHRSDWNSTLFNTLSADFAEGKAITFGFDADQADPLDAVSVDGKVTLVTHHEYFVLGFDDTNHTVELGNPWGDDPTKTDQYWKPTFWVNMDDLGSHDFNFFTVCDIGSVGVQSASAGMGVSAGIQSASAQLISAMAAMPTDVAAAGQIQPSLLSDGTLPQNYQTALAPVIAANWH